MHSPKAHSLDDHSSNTNSQNHSGCTWHESYHCLAPSHDIEGENGCYTREQLHSGVCNEYGATSNVVNSAVQTLTQVVLGIAPHLGM